MTADPWQAICDVWSIEPKDHATKSRDYGRGFADAVALVRGAIQANGITIGNRSYPPPPNVREGDDQ